MRAGCSTDQYSGKTRRYHSGRGLPGVTAAAQTPAAPGAYVLVIDLAAPLTLTNARADGHVLPPGTYAYCGSAGGPGGLRARIGPSFAAGEAAALAR